MSVTAVELKERYMNLPCNTRSIVFLAYRAMRREDRAVYGLLVELLGTEERASDAGLNVPDLELVRSLNRVCDNREFRHWARAIAHALHRGERHTLETLVEAARWRTVN